ncbi:hypothetical protein ND991_16330 [Gordonia sputi]|uniref:hypothetical protein n=1 Tax=Gordonia sputi TaxID=36823 RepID=UPI002042D9DC|nr:hypothetical protein [Gordonia sputi]MCM3896774.1 hypothetical protein [Gordonia sputi]
MTRSATLLTGASLLIALTACATTQPATTAISPSRNPGYQRPASVQWTEHWNPTPAVDLTSPDGTFIRAFIEAQDVAMHSGRPASYPGYVNADRVPHNLFYYGISPTDLTTGFSSHSIIRLDNTGPDTYIATVCRRESVNSLNKEALTVNIEWLTYHHHGTPPPANQRGPRNAPPDNVFGDW